MPKFTHTDLVAKLGYKPRSAWYGICIHGDLVKSDQRDGLLLTLSLSNANHHPKI